MSRSKDLPQRALVVATAAVVAGLAVNCGSHPTGPTGGPVGLTIIGPPDIAPGQVVAFVARAAMSDGTTEDYTRKVTWTASPPTVLTITSDTGLATGQSVGEAAIRASTQSGSNRCCTTQITKTVLPPNTYRLTGNARESGLPVQGAAISVLSGVGAGLSTTTDNGGAYRLYGVAGDIQITFRKAGYDDIVKSFTAIQNDVLDFPEAHQTGGTPSLAGAYTLTLTADPACAKVAQAGIGVLPDEFRLPRTYAATITQDGPSLTVTLTDPQIVKTKNQFTGRIDPDAVEFSIGGASNYYGYLYYGGIAEQVSATQAFEFGGSVRALRSGTTLAGALNGALETVTLPGYSTTTQCVAPNNQLTLTRAAQPSRRR